MSDTASQPLLTASLVFDSWLPEPDARVRVEILDVTYVDAPSVSIAAQLLRLDASTMAWGQRSDGTVRLPVALWGRKPDPAAEYNVVATVTAAETPEVIGRTLVAYPVITNGYPDRGVEVHIASTHRDRSD